MLAPGPVLRLGALVLLVGTVGCATDYVARSRAVQNAYEAGRTDEALALLDERFAKKKRESLLYHMERGMVLHAAGRWKESIAALQEAERLAARYDIVSVTEQAKVLVSSEGEKVYRGEDFELLLVNVINALNYWALGDLEGALVEVRRSNERMRKMQQEQKKPYQQLAVARYIGGVLYEQAGELDSAYIDYRAALDSNPNLGPLAEGAVRLAKETGRDDAYDELRRRYPLVRDDPLSKSEGEVVVVIEAGRSPEKEPSTRGVRQSYEDRVDILAVPRFRHRSWRRAPAEVSSGGSRTQAVSVTSVEDIAQIHLSDRLGRIVAKAVAATAVKAGVAATIAVVTKCDDAGILAFYLLMAGQRPDLRSWLSLPADFQVARMRLPAGAHTLQVGWGAQRSEHPVEVRPGRASLLILRRP